MNGHLHGTLYPTAYSPITILLLPAAGDSSPDFLTMSVYYGSLLIKIHRLLLSDAVNVTRIHHNYC